MSRVVTTQQKERVAQLVASGRWSNEEIAEKAGVGLRTVYRWRNRKSFIARVDAIVIEYQKRVTREGLADRSRRIGELQRHYNTLDNMIEARKARSEFAAIPDYQSGIVAITEISRVREAQPGNPAPLSSSPSSQSQPAAEGPGAEPGAEIQPGAMQPMVASIGGVTYKVRTQMDHATLSLMASLLDQISGETGQKVTRSETSFKKLEDMTNAQIVALGKSLGLDMPPELDPKNSGESVSQDDLGPMPPIVPSRQ